MHHSPVNRVSGCGRLIGLLFVFVPALVAAEVVQVDVTERSELHNIGYEEIVGRLHFEIDPKQPGNALIADIDLAPGSTDNGSRN